jgi:hypothetical protein
MIMVDGDKIADAHVRKLLYDMAAAAAEADNADGGIGENSIAIRPEKALAIET